MLEKRSCGAMVKRLLLPLALVTLSAWTFEQDPAKNEPAKPAFREIWAYVLRGGEKELAGSEPITDVGYFAATLTRNGRITDTIMPPSITLRDGFRPAVHLVIAELSNDALMHFSLNPEYGVRPLLIEDICRAAQGFDGVQIDFESVSRDDADYFIDFLKELRSSLPAAKKLSVAAPARTQLVADAYDYSRIAPIVDRIVIMAYDEHWSTSSAGPVASLSWCAKVVDYVKGVVPTEEIVMGLPLYGRAWQDKKLARALGFKNVQDLVTEKNSKTNYEPEVGAYFEYSENVVVSVFYDDDRSLLEKLHLYRDRDVSAVSFWRIGLGPPQLWSSIDKATTVISPAPTEVPAAVEPAGSPAPATSPALAPSPAPAR